MTTITESVLCGFAYAVDQHGNPKTCTRKVLPPEKKCWQHKDLTACGANGPKAGGALVSDLQHQAEALAVNEDADDEISGLFADGVDPVTEYNLDVPHPDPLTPVPQVLKVGYAPGEPVMVGGADIEDGFVTLASYRHPSKPDASVECLYATVNEAAEAKLLESLNLGATTKVPMVVTKQVTGPLDLDTENGLWPEIFTTVKSVNHHLQAGDGTPEHTKQRWDKVDGILKGLEAQVKNDEITAAEDIAMVQKYRGYLSTIGERMVPGYSVPFASGGKIPKIAQYEATVGKQVTEYVTVTTTPDGGAPTEKKSATRPMVVLDDNGEATWNGITREAAKGTEYDINLGDGYRAYYRPRQELNAQSDDFSQVGHLQIVAPTGAGHAAGLVERLANLHLSNRPMSKDEGEWVYLTENVSAMGLSNNASVKKALERARHEMSEEYFIDQLVTHRASQLDLSSASEAEIDKFARDIKLEAETQSLAARVHILREGVAKAAGFDSGEALATSAGYDPTPKRSGGWFTWYRFDMTPGNPSFQAVKGKRMYHHLTHGDKGAGGFAAMFLNSGTLASNERRRLYGVPKGVGASEGADYNTGGAKSVFLRIGGSVAGGQGSLVWEDATRLLRRTRWYAYHGDHYGSINSQSSHTTSGMITDPKKMPGIADGSNEVMFVDGFDLLGPEAPDRVICASATSRKEVLAILAKKGVTHMNGKPVEEVITTK